jgi:hypothetical protein
LIINKDTRATSCCKAWLGTIMVMLMAVKS